LGDASIVEQIERQVRAGPGCPAVTDHSSTTMTFGRLWEEASASAGLLAASAEREGQAVGLLFPNCALFVAALLGTARHGSAAILLPTSLTAGELRACTRVTGARTVLTRGDHPGLLEAAGGRLLRRARAGLEIFAFDVSARDRVQPGDFIGQFTSGVDQPSKIALRSHTAVWTEIQGVSEEIGLTASDTSFVLPSISHSYGLIGGTLAPLCRGAHVILGDRLGPEEVLRIARVARPTVMFGVPAVYRALARAPGGGREDLCSLRLCFSAGAPLPRDVDDRFAERYMLRTCQDYGSTEVGTISLRLGWTPRLASSVGRPMRHLAVTIVDAHGRQVPPGQRGEVVVRSPVLARCYLGASPAGPTGLHGDHLATGDLGWLDDEGYLFLTGRRSSLIQVAGAEIDPAEVEAVISRLPGVRDVAVIGVAGGAKAGLKAVVVAEGLTASRIQQHCRAHLADSQVPAIIEFREAIPRTPAGKVLRRALRNNMEGAR